MEMSRGAIIIIYTYIEKKAEKKLIKIIWYNYISVFSKQSLILMSYP